MTLAASSPRCMLAPMNFRNYQYLVQGKEIPGLEGLRGKELDYALVEMEQKAVTAIMEQYFEGVSVEDRVRVLGGISGLSKDPLRSVLGVSDPTGYAPVPEATAVIQKLFPKGDYDFGNEQHRIAVGKAMIDERYQETAEALK